MIFVSLPAAAGEFVRRREPVRVYSSPVSRGDDHAPDRADGDLRRVRRALEGDSASLEELVAAHRAYVFTIAYRITLNEDDALDVTQTVFLKVMARLADYAGKGDFRSWIGGVAVRAAVDYERRERARRETPTPPEALQILAEAVRPNPLTDPREVHARRDEIEKVYAAMSRLTGQQRAAIALCLDEALPPREVAARLGIPAKQASAQIKRAIVRLREILGTARAVPRLPEAKARA